MKALDWHKFRRYPKKPSYMLGFLLALVIWVLTIFVVSEIYGRVYVWDTPQANLASPQWVVLVGVVAAVIGWIVSAQTTMRNSIKQHTINTLLQSRMSATYMENARAVNKHYFGPGGSVYSLTQAELLLPADDIKLRELSYILNYLEFISAAVRYGDLDEKLMRMTLRGMLCNIYEVSLEYIKASQQTNATSFEHLSWLYDFWFEKALQRPGVPRPAAVATPIPPAQGVNAQQVTVGAKTNDVAMASVPAAAWKTAAAIFVLSMLKRR